MKAYRNKLSLFAIIASGLFCSVVSGAKMTTDEYLESADYLKDTACYMNYMGKEVDKVLKGKPTRKGYESLQLMSKGQLYVEKSKARRTVKYKSSLYKTKTGKVLKLSTCLSYKKLVAKGEKLDVPELLIMEFANSFRK